MKPILSILFFILLSLPVLAQKPEIAKGDTAAASRSTRVALGVNSTGRFGQKANTGNFERFALYSELQSFTGGAVTSVNGQGGPSVTLTSANIAENTNLYYTQARARSAISGSAPISYNSTTGVISWSGAKSDVGLSNVDNTSDLNKPISTATQTALNGKEATLPTGSTSQYFRGDKTLATLDKSAVGLANVDNTLDVNKPISTATQNALDLKATATQTIYRLNAASYAAMAATSVPAGSVYLIKVAADETYPAPYNTNQWYFKDGDSGAIFKLQLNKEN